ncbi:MAG: alkaline phosphatase family protein [Mycobacterium sp.]|nr:alkaline phosphatase family protein [Mycobacterium sp.]
MKLPRPHSDIPHLADVAPSVLAAMGVADFRAPIALPGPVMGACVLLVDGLGAELLDNHAADAPVLAEMRSGTLSVGFPSTTAAGLAAVGTGCASGEHGMVGYSFRLPGTGVINAVRWRPHPWGADLRESVLPEAAQPRPTIFERAVGAGAAVSVISGTQFAGSGLTRAVLRGGRYIGVHALGDLAARISDEVSGGGFCYGYHSELDMLGHLYGPGSLPWRMQLRQVDRMVESLVESLPAGGLLAVVADHGMVAIEPGAAVDLDSSPTLLAGVEDLGGEPRARYVYTRAGAQSDVLQTWQEILGGRAWVVSREEAIESGWFGPRVLDAVRSRIGDVVAAARDSNALVRLATEPAESALLGHHGSLTEAEQLVPLLLAFSE